MFGAGFGGLTGARVIATRTTTTHQVATGGGGSAAMHFDQLKTLALNMGMAASAGAVKKNEAEEKAAAAAATIAQLEKALANARREVRRACLRAPRLAHRRSYCALSCSRGLTPCAAPAFGLCPQVMKLQEYGAHLKKAQDEQAAKQGRLGIQINLLGKTLRDNHAKLKKGAARFARPAITIAHLRSR